MKTKRMLPLKKTRLVCVLGGMGLMEVWSLYFYVGCMVRQVKRRWVHAFRSWSDVCTRAPQPCQAVSGFASLVLLQAIPGMAAPGIVRPTPTTARRSMDRDVWI